MSPSSSGDATVTATATEQPVMETTTLEVAKIVPYWRNPRRISDEAINAVMESIRQYGYQQPIIVDVENVIIAGHTRYSALRRMGVTEIPVIVARGLTPKQVKELRTIDNRTSEYTSWDFNKLVAELEGMESDLMQAFFPEIVASQADAITDADEHTLVIDVTTVDTPQQDTEFICPTCFHQWVQNVTREDILSGRIEFKEGAGHES